MTEAALNSSAILTEVNLATVAADGGKVALAKDEAIVIVVDSTGAAAQTLTVKAGSYDAAGIGDLAITLAQNVQRVIGPLEGMRFAQADGYAYIDMTATTGTGSISAIDVDF
jgi:hypothetical protein